MKTLQQLQASAQIAQERIESLILNPGFMRGEYVAGPGDLLVNDMDEAIQLSSDQEITSNKGNDYCDWTEVLEFNTPLGAGEIIDSMSKEEQEILWGSLSLRDFPLASAEAKMKALGVHHFLRDVIIENLASFFNQLSYFDGLNIFHQRLWQVYQSGGFPCGWKGIPPDMYDNLNGEGYLLIYNHAPQPLRDEPESCPLEVCVSLTAPYSAKALQALRAISPEHRHMGPLQIKAALDAAPSLSLGKHWALQRAQIATTLEPLGFQINYLHNA